MSVPAATPSFVVASNGVDTVQLSHGAPAASPSLLGYKYFRSTASQSAVIALAQADIDAGGQASPSGLLTDVDSPTIGGKAFSRAPLPPTIYFNDLPGSYGTKYYAAVAWNTDGASSIVTASINHIAASLPTVSVVVCTETTLDVTFNQTVTCPNGRLGEGFSFTADGAIQFTSAAAQVAGDTIRFTMASVINHGALVKVSFNNALSDLRNATGATKAASFTNQVAVNNSQHAALLSLVCAQLDTEPQVITLTFSLPVVSAAYATGLTVKVNGQVTAFASAAQGASPRVIRITFAGAFQFNDALLVSYSGGDWTSNSYPIAAFTDRTVSNASKIGTPDSQYPLSSVVEEPLVAHNGSVTATVGVDFNSIDQLLTTEYGPVVVDLGGTFGITQQNPHGVLILQDLRPVISGSNFSKTFTVPSRPDQAAFAAADWQQTIAQRIGTLLAAMRATDQQVVLGQRTVKQV